MAVIGYFNVFPEKTTTELRTAAFEEDDTNDLLPGGTFIFTEYYCTDPNCDCQRVLVKVLHAKSEDAVPDDVATISYTWNSDDKGTWKAVNSEMPNPFLDPFHQQAPYASELLDFWNSMIKHDKAYALRLRRHYEEIRTEMQEPEGEEDQRDFTTHEAHARASRPLTKRERKARRQRLVKARKRK